MNQLFGNDVWDRKSTADLAVIVLAPGSNTIGVPQLMSMSESIVG